MTKWTPGELRREEVRGVFAIGVVAILITWRQLPEAEIVDVTIPFSSEVIVTFNVNYAINMLTLVWALYIVLIAVSLGENLFKAGRIRNLIFEARNLGYVFFFVGIIVLLFIAAILFWPVTALIPPFVLALLFYREIKGYLKRRRKESRISDNE